jgi:acyl-coenzyme A thioesterase PaaI-like protein
MQVLNEQQIAMLRQAGESMVSSVPHSIECGLEVVFVEPANASLRAPYREHLSDGEERLAHGVISVLIDHCCGLAIVAAGGSRPMATLDLRIDYMCKPAARSAITAKAHCYGLQPDIGFVRAEAFDDEGGEPIASAQATFMLNRTITAPT